MKKNTGLAALLMFATVAFSADYSGWKYYRDITLNPTTAGGITAAETNYPLLIRLNTAGSTGAGSFDFSQAMANGADVRFTAADNTTDLSYEVERWDSTAGAAEIWVKVNSVSNSANTVIRMYWGKSGSTATASGPAVFSSTINSFRAVFHFNNSIASSADRAITPVNTGTTDITTASIIGGHARSTVGTGTTNTANFIDLGASTADTGLMNSGGASTLGAWVYVTAFATAASSYGTVIAHGAGDNAEHFLRSSRTSSTATNWSAGLWNGTDYKSEFGFTNTNEVNNWHYIVGTWTGGSSGSIITLYRDGIQVGTPATLGASFTGSVQNWVIGRYGATTTGRYFQGHLDEARIAATARSASWVKWDFETQKAAQTCLTFGTTVALSVPGAPTGVTATAGNAQATVSWTAPTSNGGAAITGYTATAAPGGATCATTGSLTCTVLGLTNLTPYIFTVTATNPAGTSAASTASSPVIPTAPAGVPGSPTGVSAVAGSAQAVVSWTAPTSDGGSPITGYTVSSNPDGKTCTTTGAVTCTVTTLTNGTAYTFTVTAANTSGSSAASSASAAVTPMGVPGAPTTVTATASAGQAVVTWIAPAATGGSAITGYTATAGQDTSKKCSTTGAVTCTITGLTNGTTYTFTVVARNSVGTSAASAASSPVTPVTVPGSPTSVTGVGASGQVTVSWVAPSATGGSPITGYTVTAVQDTSRHCATTGALTCAVTGLINTIAYTFTVTATNSAGTSVASNPSNAVTGLFSFNRDMGLRVKGSSMFLRLPEFSGSGQISMTDVWGRTVWNRTVGAGTREISWGRGASGIVPGLYILRLTLQDANHKTTLAAESKILLTP